MAIYHFVFNLQNFKLIDFNIFTNTYGIIWRGLILGTFLVCVGISLVIISNNTKKKVFYKKSTFQLFFASCLVSLASYIVFPKMWIFFGVLHFIFLAKFIMRPFLHKAKLSLFMGISILGVYLVFGAYNPFIYLYGISIFPIVTLDMINMVPWLSAVFFGIFLGHYPLYKYLPYKEIKFFEYISKNSLLFYLLHQVLLFPIVALINFFVLF